MNRREFAQYAAAATFAATAGLGSPLRAFAGEPSGTGFDRAMAAARATFRALASRGLPGALVGIAHPSHATRRFAIGTASRESGAPLTVDMTMRFGSIAKLFVGTVALQLVDEGQLSLDAPVSSFRKDVPGGERITIRRLGTHTSGLFNPLRDPRFRDRISSSPSRHIPREDILAVAFANSRGGYPRPGFQYSNANTILLADIAERVTGTAIADLVRLRLLEPAGATGIHDPESYELAAPSPRGYRHGAAPGRIEYGTVLFDATDFSASWADAAGNMNGRLEDLLRVGRQLARGALLSDASLREQRAFIDVAPGFSYGFCIARYGQVLGHAGDVPGFSSFLGYLPERDVLVAVLCNLSNLADKSAPATGIAMSIFDALAS